MGDIFDSFDEEQSDIFDMAEEPEEEGLWEGFVKPTLKAIPKVVGTAATGLLSMPVAGLTGLGVGALAQYDKLMGKDVDPWIEANKAMEGVSARGNLVTTPEEQRGLENVMLPMKPFEMAREGWREIGELSGIPYAEPVLGAIGETSAMLGLPAGLAKLKMGKGFKERPIEKAYGQETVIPERPAEVIPERPEPLKIKTRAERDVFDEAVLTELGKPERIEAKDYVLEEVRSEALEKLTEKPVVETLPEVKAGRPVVSRASLNDSMIQLSFDESGKVPTIAELKQAFPGAEVVQTQPGLISATTGTKHFRIDVFDDAGRLSSQKAKGLYSDVLGGLPERFSRPTTLEQSIPFEERFKTVVDTANDRLSGINKEVKVETGAKEIVEPEPISESTKMERVVPEFEPTVSSPLPQGPGAKTAGFPDIGEDIVKQRNLGSKKDPLLQPAIKRSEFEAITELKDLPPAVFERGEIGKGAQLFGGITENPIRTFDKLGAKAKDLFYYPVREAWHGYKSQHKGLMDAMNTVTKGMKKQELENIGAYAIAQQSNGVEILTNMGREIPKLSPKEAKTYQWFRDKYEDLYGQLQFAREQAGLDSFGKVENYFTFFREYSTMRDLGFDPLRMAADQFRSVADNIHLKGTVFRFAKERGDWQAPLELNAKNVFSVYSDYATRHINMSPVISKGRELIGTYKIKDVKDIPIPIDEKGQTKFDFAMMERVVKESQFALNEKAPRTHQFIEKWLDYSAGQKPPTNMPPVIERSLRKLNQNIAFAVLGGNLRSALVQPAALLNTMTEIGVRSTAKGIYSLMKGEGSKAMKDSQVLVGRDYDASIQTALEGWSAKAGEIKAKAGAASMEPLKALDMMSAKATWLGAYDSVKGKMNYRDTVRYADDVVTRTQGSATPFDLSPAQRTTLGKTLSMFQTFVINQWGFVTRDVLGIRNPEVSKLQALKKTTEFIVGAALLNSLYEAAGMNPPLPAPISTFMKETAKDTPFGEAMFKAALEPTSMLPYLGGARFGYLPFGPVGDLAKQGATMLKESRLPNKREAFEIGGKLAGIPGTSQISKMVKAYERDQTPYEIAVGSPPSPEQYKAYVKKKRKQAVRLREAKKRARY